MAITLPTAEEMLEKTIRKVSSSPDEWLRFLNTASRVYQYDFSDQLMIYAQRPGSNRMYKFSNVEKDKSLCKAGNKRNRSYPDCKWQKEIKICV